MSQLLMQTSIIITLLTLTMPITSTLYHPTYNGYLSYVKTSVMLAWITSLLPLVLFINYGTKLTIISVNWINIASFSVNMSFIFDQYSLTFTPIALFVTWSILEFASWYMAEDPLINRFFKYLLIFLIAMVILVTANNMLQFFIGWEGVGIMSFLLIGWWSARTNANTSAMQAIIYNRIGDIGLVLTITWLAMNSTTWEFQQIFQLETTNIVPLIGLILAAAGKSAQFGLHPWLPAAMEGPTPVSALLHSSTMVVAGIFLLIRLHPMLEKNNLSLTICLCLGAATTLFTAICALTQNDIKKIIAFSTSSQLGLMMVSIGLNHPELAFLHISTHAFFKALLFLCSGTIIHALKNEQDLRMMGGVKKTLPITSSCMTIGSLALMGAPFLAGFYSKDTIIETMNNSSLNAWALAITLIATMLTAAYSMRIIFYVQMKHTRNPTLTHINEESTAMLNPLTRLTLGSILAGTIIATTILPMKVPTLTMSTESKFSALIVTTLGLYCAYELLNQTALITPWKQHITNTYSNQLGFFNILHRNCPNTSLNLGQKNNAQDLSWLEKIGPLGLANMMSAPIKKTSAQRGLMKAYLTTFILTIITGTLLT